jgi:hypothetical protein
VRGSSPFWRLLAGLALFAIAFGYVEAAVVAYLRSMYAPLRAHYYPGSASELFPLLSLAQLRALGPEHVARLKIELGRELATLFMLAGAAAAATRKPQEWVAAFVLCFGIWDLSFYAFLKLLLGWPASLATWDILFLLPAPWVGPVWAPVVVSASMIGAGILALWRESVGRPVRLGAWGWVGVASGGALVFAAFIADFRNTASAGNPQAFHWWLFAIGELVGVGAFGASARRGYEAAGR